MTKLLNLGCGPRFSSDPAWTNVDFHSNSPHVIAHDLSRGIPFPDATFDAVYHSHVLEHFSPQDGARFIAECWRALKPGGILRVAVPDLEQICRLYLAALEGARAGDESSRNRYDWLKLEMYDQSVRTNTGGAMAEYLRQASVPEQEFIISRAGNVARELMGETSEAQADSDAQADATQATSAQNLKGRLNKSRRAPQRIGRFISTLLMSKRDREALALGQFRMSGEIHQWMYDDYSLRVVLEEANFKEVRRCRASESRIPRWNDYRLDVDADGFEHAPSSLYMEGIKA
ncbi:MAG TPA: methyltransferase domain-containing protein [Pyrinomonadaceae bacterium]|jgi:SAM-dependent methyltransferase